ncbi:MAG: hypothetical protein PHE50_07305 [Dehalococcoidales bacterium]|nr:hypothetical protein [Dehalococcoidales bacterium]
MNLAGKIKQAFPPETVALMGQAADIADAQKQDIYLVGGAVRDLLLGLPIDDIDITVNGSAIDLAQKLALVNGGKLVIHPLFNTATLKTADATMDFAMLRTETYAKPGALPAVTPGTLEADLLRRDFTINAMAIGLNKNNYGQLVDLYDGKQDLDNGLIRVLHENSFIDDATRIWRALRYEIRLGFRIEHQTRSLMKRDARMLPTVGGFRLRHELELVLQEKEPEKILTHALTYNALHYLHPALQVDHRLTTMYRKLREINKPHPVPADIYLALLFYPLQPEALAEAIKYLRFTKTQIATIQQCRQLKLDGADPSGAYGELSRLMKEN